MRVPARFWLRAQIRRAVVASSRGMLLSFYRGLYSLAIWRVRAVLGSDPEVMALYLRRGGGKGEIRPGISDLDFAAIVEGSSQGQQAVSAYRKIARWIPFLEKDIDVYDVGAIRNVASKAGSRYRFAEGKQTWRCLLGRDILQELPHFQLPDLYAGLYRESLLWPTLWIHYLLRHPYLCYDEVLSNSISYKVLAEFLRLDFAWFEGLLTYSRSEALSWVTPQPEKLQRVERENFLGPAHEFREYAWKSILSWCASLQEGIARHSYGTTGRSWKSVHLGESTLTCAQRDWLKLVQDCALQTWGSERVRVEVARPLNFPLDNLTVLLRFEEGHEPAWETLRSTEWAVLNTDACRLYVEVGGVALALRPDLDCCDDSILGPCTHPEVFIPLGIQVDAGSSLYWEQMSGRWGRLADDPDCSPLTFLREFWKSCQLAVVVNRALHDELCVPHRPDDIVSALATARLPIYKFWEDLRDAYCDLLVQQNHRLSHSTRSRVSIYLSQLWEAARTR